jgi:multiple antibiotic resistance protein
MNSWTSATDSLLLAFPALFSIVNPIACALIFSQLTSDSTPEERRRLAGKVALYATFIMLAALWGGTSIMNFFGISLGALRLAGGLVVVSSAWGLLFVPERQEARKQEQAGQTTNPEDAAFFPLTMPFTTGPGTISVAITLGSNRPAAVHELIPLFLGNSGAAVLMGLVIWGTYRYADRLSALLGHTGTRIFTRLSAFILLCIGAQILLNGAEDALRPLLLGRADQH